MLTYGSLFTGIGGFDAGFDAAGMKCLFQVEKDKHARSVLRKHWPSVKRYSDVKEVTTDELVHVNVLCGGFPCQDVSVAGKRKGLAGERSGLWFEFHKIIVNMQPGWVVIENVPGLLSSNEGRDFAIVLGGLTGVLPEVPEGGWKNAGLARGHFYSASWRVLDSQYFGVAQRRRRVFIVASLGNGGSAEVLFERESLFRNPAEGREAGKGVASDVAPIATASGRGVKGCGGGRRQESAVYGFQTRIARNGRGDMGNICNALNAQSGGTGKGDASPCVAIAESGQESMVPWEQQGRRIQGENGIYPTVMCNPNGGMKMEPVLSTGVRRLTPKECERLQGFGDDHTAIGIDEDGIDIKISDSQRYKMCGNAVTRWVPEWFGKRLVSVHNGNQSGHGMVGDD
jgi:DNA (cytosine-5)-methyltransferase 1